MKKLTRLILCLTMLLVSIGTQAQTAADAMYRQGITLKKQGTRQALTNAISKFTKAKGLYATQAGKARCTAQIKECNFEIKQSSNKTHKNYNEKNDDDFINDEEFVFCTKKGIFNEEIKSITDDAKNGSVEAQKFLGLCYYNGWEFTGDYDESLKWFKMAAQQNDAYAQFYIGDIYDIVYDNFEEAEKWYTKSANNGSMLGIYSLGIFYYNRVEYEKGIEWLKKVSDEDYYLYVKANEIIGECYFKGLGIEQNFEEAIKYRKKADYEKNKLFQHYDLGVSYYQKKNEKDLENAKRQFNFAIAEGDFRGYTMLGNIYYEQEDYSKAIDFYKRAALCDDSDAQYYLGNCYENGKGTNRDFLMAKIWYKISASQENDSAITRCLNLGIDFNFDKNELSLEEYE